MLGVAVGVTALVIALALMTGLQGELRDRILGSSAHVYVWKQGGIADYHAEVAKLRKVPGVTGAAPAILGKALLRTGREDAFITFKGIDPALEGSVTDLARSVEQGSLKALVPAAEGCGARHSDRVRPVQADRRRARRRRHADDAGGHVVADGPDPALASLQGGRDLQARTLRVRFRVRVRVARHRAAHAREDAARPAGDPRGRHLLARPLSPTASPPISATST